MASSVEFHVDVDSTVQEMRESLSIEHGEGGIERREFKKVVRGCLLKARRGVLKAASSEVAGRDVRKAAKAVRAVVYKRSLGGNINIMEPRGKIYTMQYEKPRNEVKKVRGGNKAPRSERTKQVDSYYGPSRAFVLRFLNSGAGPREAGTRGYKFRGANRGQIAARGWFDTAGTRFAEEAAAGIGEGVAAAVVDKFNK